jgi:hypothetical protein
MLTVCRKKFPNFPAPQRRLSGPVLVGKVKGKGCPVKCEGGTKRGRCVAIPVLDYGTRRGYVVLDTPGHL